LGTPSVTSNQLGWHIQAELGRGARLPKARKRLPTYGRANLRRLTVAPGEDTVCRLDTASVLILFGYGGIVLVETLSSQEDNEP